MYPHKYVLSIKIKNKLTINTKANIVISDDNKLVIIIRVVGTVLETGSLGFINNLKLYNFIT